MQLVSVEKLQIGMTTALDVYPHDGGHGIPLVRKNTGLNSYMIRELQERGVRFVYIKDRSDNTTSANHVFKVHPRNLYVPKPKPIIGTELRGSAVARLQSVFQAALTGEIHPSSQIVKHIDEVVEHLVDSIDQKSLVNIEDLKSYDEYTYHHSLSVAVLAIAIGQHFGYQRTELKRLGKCAIMHDIGKTAVPVEIINKPSNLDEDEYNLVKGHSSAGYDYLFNGNIGDDKMWAGVLGHHEKVDGTGYPFKLRGDDIPIWSRIISVADVYDALTSVRPYRSPMQPAEAIEYIMGGVGSSFDYDVVSSFVKKVEIYPVGSYVELSNGVIAVVLNTRNPMRPVVRNLETGDVYDLQGDRQLLSVVINRVIQSTELRSLIASAY